MRREKTVSSFWIFLACNSIFFILQCALVISAHKNVIGILSPLMINPEIIFTICIHAGLYILLSAIQASLIPVKSYENSTSDRWIIILLASTISALLSANALYFPHSVSGNMVNALLPGWILYVILLLSVSVLLTLIVSAFWKILLFILPVLLCWVLISTTSTVSSQEKPNIIIIGVDSLPAKMVNKYHMPKLTALVNNSVHFTNTITPLAKTHPAWMSILTGLYPAHHGAIENLVPEENVKNKGSIAWLLRKNGYQTWFATDEKRFSNIGFIHGFQKTLGPKAGINDFFLGLFNDFPLTNMLVNHRIFARLFPYNYINRASYFSYYPQSFTATLQNALTEYKQDQPLFLNVHFTLPHWPYMYANSNHVENKEMSEADRRHDQYVQALREVDTQIEKLYNTLREQGILENSLLIFLSDHGETLSVPGSRPLKSELYRGKNHLFAQYLKNNFSMDLDKSMGHGSDLLSPDQFQTLLAVQLRERNIFKHRPGTIQQRVALIDVAPTIQDFLKIQKYSPTDGISLYPQILDPEKKFPSRPFFMESGMLPNVGLSMDVLGTIVRDLYVVEKHNLLLRAEKLPDINAQKLFGIIEEDWLLALYPENNQYIAVMYQISTGLWTDDAGSIFAQSTPFSALLKKMEVFHQRSFAVSYHSTSDF